MENLFHTAYPFQKDILQASKLTITGIFTVVNLSFVSLQFLHDVSGSKM